LLKEEGEEERGRGGEGVNEESIPLFPFSLCVVLSIVIQ
jgi:hypothetical protein